MRKYKVGNKIRIKSIEWYKSNCDDLGFVRFSPINFNPKMQEYCGREAVITEASKSGEYRLDIDSSEWMWTEEMFEETGSKKNDRKDDKVMMELLPWPELEEIAKVYTAGAKKYGAHNWENLPDGYERYKGAMLRHLTEIEKGNNIDADTGCLHAAQVAWNAIAMLHFKLEEQKGLQK